MSEDEMKTKFWLKRIVQVIFFLIPLAFGFIGYYQVYSGSYMNAMYSSMRLYTLNVDVQEINIWIEIARWIAPLATLSGMMILIESFGNKVTSSVKRLSKNCVAVYGESVFSREIINKLGVRGIATKSKTFIPAKNYILLFDTDEENIRFYTTNKNKLENRMVYININNINQHSISSKNVRLFSINENIARVYWGNNPITSLIKNIDVYNVAIIGFGDLGQELLSFGLTYNLYSKKQQINYHIFGDTKEYFGLHKEISSIPNDNIIIHNGEWYEELELFKAMDRILLCSNEHENLVVLSKLKTYALLKPKCEYYVHVSDDDVLRLIDNDFQVISFGTFKEQSNLDYIFNEALNQEAINMHKAYMMLNEKAVEWNELDNFVRYSNISFADYNSIRKAIILMLLNDKNYEEIVELLAELEHMRWCRFHYVYNWKKGEKLNRENKEHDLLVSYQQLSDEEKEKNRVIARKSI